MPAEQLKKFGLDEPIRTAAVCVYPNRVADAHYAIQRLGLSQKLSIASGNLLIDFLITLSYLIIIHSFVNFKSYKQTILATPYLHLF